jgi:hypothetical protein
MSTQHRFSRHIRQPPLSRDRMMLPSLMHRQTAFNEETTEESSSIENEDSQEQRYEDAGSGKYIRNL